MYLLACRWNLRWRGIRLAIDPFLRDEVAEMARKGRCPYSAAYSLCQCWEIGSCISAVPTCSPCVGHSQAWREHRLTETLRLVASYVDFIVAAKETGVDDLYIDALHSATLTVVDALFHNKGEALRPQYSLEF